MKNSRRARRISAGFTLIEIMIAVGILALLAAIALVAYVNYVKVSETADTLATYATLRERLLVVARTDGSGTLQCDERLVGAPALSDPYADFAVVPLPLDPSDESLGFGIGLTVRSDLGSHAADGVAATRAFHESLTSQQARIRDLQLTDSLVAFSVLVTAPDEAVCEPPVSRNPLPPLTPPNVALQVSAAQEVLDTGSSGRAVVDRLNTGGDMDAFTLEFSVVGRAGGSATASTGPVIFNYGNAGDNNLISAWRPSNFTLALGGKNLATGIDLTDGQSHRVTIGWDAASGTARVYDNGRLAKEFTGVLQGQSVAGEGHLVVGQKMNDVAARGGWNANEHYSGQVFGTSFATRTFSADEIAQAPLYTRGKDLVADLRSSGGAIVDMVGGHSVDMQGAFSSTSVQVDTRLALIPPGSEVRVSAQATSVDPDAPIERVSLTGLGRIAVEDGAGNSGSGDVDVTGWNLSDLRLRIPPGQTGNADLRLVAEVRSADGRTARAEASSVVRLQP